MNKFILVLAFIALVSCKIDYDAISFHKFQKFIKKYHKKYTSIQEYMARFTVFKDNLLKAFSYTNGNEDIPFTTGVTKFSDLTEQEFAKTYLNLDFGAMAYANFSPETVKISNAAPDAFSWKDQGVVSGVKDQASCGSCWAFSTVGNLEGLYAIKKGTVKTFSEQYLVDCDTSDSGCNGGLMERTFTWLKSAGGIMYESDYAYTGSKGTCKKDTTKFADFKVTGYKKLGTSSSTFSPVDEDEVKEYLYATGPLAIALNATPLQTYTGGVLDLTASKCSTSGINHAVLLVGYGHDSSTDLDYWLVKNSWGSSWGESGYFRISRGKSTCGVNYYVTTALVSF